MEILLPPFLLLSPKGIKNNVGAHTCASSFLKKTYLDLLCVVSWTYSHTNKEPRISRLSIHTLLGLLETVTETPNAPSVYEGGRFDLTKEIASKLYVPFLVVTNKSKKG
jgi:hypothetical protein